MKKIHVVIVGALGKIVSFITVQMNDLNLLLTSFDCFKFNQVLINWVLNLQK